MLIFMLSTDILLRQINNLRHRRHVLMARIIIHPAIWNSREETQNCVQQLLLYDLVHKIDLATLLR